MAKNKDIFEITFHARGGQGAKTTAEIIAHAAVKEGKFVQAFPQFGPERSGAPTKTYVRISDKPIRTHETVIDPDVVMVLDETILEAKEVLKSFGQREIMIINSKKSAGELKELIGFAGKIYPIDASGISMEIIGAPRPNTVILGKFVQVTKAVELQSVADEFRKIFSDKIGQEATEKNIQAIEKAYNTA